MTEQEIKIWLLKKLKCEDKTYQDFCHISFGELVDLFVQFNEIKNIENIKWEKPLYMIDTSGVVDVNPECFEKGKQVFIK